MKYSMFINQVTSLKVLVSLLLILYLSTTAMLMEISNVFLLLLFFIALFNMSGLKKSLMQVGFFRAFSSVIILIFILVTVHSLLYLETSFLFSYRYEVFKYLLIFPIVLYLLWKMQYSSEELFKIILLTSIYTIFYSIAVLITDPQRGTGLLSGPIHLGSLAVVYAMLSLIIFGFAKEKWMRILAIVIFFFGALLSFLSGSKGGWLAFILVFISIGAYLFLTNRERFKLYFFVCVSMVAVLYFLWDLLPLANRLENAYSGLKSYLDGHLTENSVGARIEIWKAAIIGISGFNVQDLLIGRGFMSFEGYWSDYINSGLSLYNNPHPHPHNDFLKVMFEFGVLGCLIFALLFWTPVKYLIASIRYSKTKIPLLFLGIILVEMFLEFMLTDKVIFVKSLLHTYLFLITLIVFAAYSSKEINCN